MTDLEDPQSRPRGVYWLPNLLTTGALFAGFYAVVAAIDWKFDYAGVAVFVAMVFDGLDGRVARWTHTESAFGKEYDSLSDMVSFGIAPAIVTYQWGVARIAEYGPLWRRFGWLVCFFYAAAAALRLARFNSRAAVQDKHYFEGLAEPVGRRHRRRTRLARERSSQHRPPRPHRRVRGHGVRGRPDDQPLRVLQLQAGERRRARALHANRACAARVRIHLPVSSDLAAAHLRRLCPVRTDGVGCTASCFAAARARRRRPPHEPRPAQANTSRPSASSPGSCATAPGPGHRRSRGRCLGRTSSRCRRPARTWPISAGRNCGPQWRLARAAR